MTIARVQLPEKSVYFCRVLDNQSYQAGDRCIAEFDYGRDQCEILEILSDSGERPPAFRLLHTLSVSDQKRIQDLQIRADKIAKEFITSIHESNSIKILHTRLSLDQQRFFFRYSAPEQMDLRKHRGPFEQKYHTRMDIWQISPREETATLGGVGICGRCLCCAAAHSCGAPRPKPVNLNMARAQNFPLTTQALNGCCDCLKCCLRYELESDREDPSIPPAKRNKR